MSSSVSSGPPISSKLPESRDPHRGRCSGIGVPVDRIVKPSHAAGHVYALDRWLAGQLWEAIGDPAVHFVLWDGREVPEGNSSPVARVVVHDRPTLLKLVVGADLHFGDAYSAGRIDVEGDLLALLESIFRADSARWKPPGRVRAALATWQRQQQSNTVAGSRSNIHHHYDIGNEFYQLWLDKQMLYTCAYFPSPETTLEEAQVAKMDLICRKLWLRPGETVVEAGCGWGALACHMAGNYGVLVKAYNVSHEQIEYARARARAEGLASRVEFIEDDYRNIAGQFDAFVSIGMLEHVGVEHYQELGGVIHRCLRPDGRGMIHTIGRDFPDRLNRWIERRIFPGANPPSLCEMMEVFEPWRLSVLDVENLRLHYAQTIRHWLARFEAAADRVAAMFDESLVRAWRLYLIGSIAAFTCGTLQLFQVLFARNAMNQIPWTRDRLYDSSA